MSTTNDWTELRSIAQEIAITINNAFVFDKLAIFLITNNNLVYGFGENTNGCIGCGHNNKVIEPIIIKELCGKTVINIQFGGDSNVLALTQNNHIYSWGCNAFGQLANGNTTACYSPIIIGALNDLKIIDVRCGLWHCMALTDDGKLYGWGYNVHGELGIGNINSPVMAPTQLTSLNENKIIAAECGGYHSMALTDNGKVFVWGHNGCGQLGNGNTNNTHTPIQLNLDNSVLISKIRCGNNHGLLLSFDGDIYAFGYNKFGQIGDGSVHNKSVALKLNMPFKCVDIYAKNLNHISIAKLENGFCYVWGECVGQTLMSPKESNYESINDVIINYSKLKWNYDNISYGSHSVISKRLIASFNDRKYSDITFKVDNQLIYVQKQYLITVCKHFEAMFNENNWSENSENVITITQYSYPVYHAFLKYLYTGCVEIETEHVFDLLDLANSYLEEEVKLKCAQIIKREISIENVCIFYSSAAKYELNELMQCCFSFAVNEIKSVIKTVGFKQSEDISLVKALLCRCVAKN